MKFSQLKAQLDNMSDDELQQDAVVYVEQMDEYLPVGAVTVTPDDDVLDAGHFVIECPLSCNYTGE